MARPKNLHPECSLCGVELTVENSSPSEYRCRVCNAERARGYYARDREKSRQACRDYHNRIRSEVLAAYGGACACCGESTPEFLQIDHIHNDGAKHRQELSKGRWNTRGGSIYRVVKKEGFPKDRYQLLCGTCNFAKGRYGGVCPHARLSLVELVKSGKKLEFSAAGLPSATEPCHV